MPKGPNRYACATCGKWERISLKEHHKKVHQKECTVQFKGEHERVTCHRDADGLWRCPKCGMEFEGTPRKLQTHGLKGECLAVVGGVPQTPQPLQPLPKPEPQSKRESVEHQPNASDRKDVSNILPSETTAADEIVSPDDILGNYMNELADEEAFIQQLLDEEARDMQDVEMKLSRGPGSDWEPDFFQSSSSIMKHEEEFGGGHGSFSHGCVAITPERRLSVKAEEQQNFVHDNLSAIPRPDFAMDGVKSEMQTSEPSWPKLEPSHSVPKLQYEEASDRQAHRHWLNSSSTSRHSPSPSAHAPPTARSVQNAEARASYTPELLPAALQAFLGTLRIPLEHLAHIFVRQRITTDDALDLLCEAPPRELDDLKCEILYEGRLAGWLAVQRGLEERARRRALCMSGGWR